MNWRITKITVDGVPKNSVSWVTSGGTELSSGNNVYSGPFDVSVSKFIDSNNDSGEYAVITISGDTNTYKNIILKRCVVNNNCSCNNLNIFKDGDCNCEDLNIY